MTGWLPEGTAEWGGRPVARTVAEAAPRRRAVLSGAVREVRERAVPAPCCDALLEDGTGTITLRWVGRQRVPGMEAGQPVTVEGTVTHQRGVLVLLNPLYRFGRGPHPGP